MTAATKTETMAASGQRKPTGRGKRTAQKVIDDEQAATLEQQQQVTAAGGGDEGLPLSKEEGPDDELHPLPESASGFRYGLRGRRERDDFPRPLSPTFSYPCRDILEMLLSPVFSPVL